MSFMCCSIVSGILIAIVVFGISETFAFTVLTMIAMVIAFSFIVTTIILHYSAQNKTSVQCRAEADQIKSMYSLYTGAGVISILPNVAQNEAMTKIETLFFTASLFIVSGVIAQYYRKLCERKYENEEQKENEQKQLLQELVEHLKKIDAQKTETTSAESSANPQIPNNAQTSGEKLLSIKVSGVSCNVEVSETK